MGVNPALNPFAHVLSHAPTNGIKPNHFIERKKKAIFYVPKNTTICAIV
jgi:hypothetical protein